MAELVEDRLLDVGGVAREVADEEDRFDQGKRDIIRSLAVEAIEGQTWNCGRREPRDRSGTPTGHT